MAGNVLPWWSSLWCMQQTIPYSLDTASLSALEILNKLVLAVDGLVADGKLMASEIDSIQQTITELDKLVKDVASGKYADLYLEQLENYINDNLTNLVARIVRYVFPTFYWDGECWRFALDVPANWNWLRFQWWFCEDDTWHIGLQY